MDRIYSKLVKNSYIALIVMLTFFAVLTISMYLLYGKESLNFQGKEFLVVIYTNLFMVLPFSAIVFTIYEIEMEKSSAPIASFLFCILIVACAGILVGISYSLISNENSALNISTKHEIKIFHNQLISTIWIFTLWLVGTINSFINLNKTRTIA